MNPSLTGNCREIISLIERIFAPSLSEVAARLCNLRINGDSRRFVVNRMGSTGSTWLAKLLNSHADVYCSHEGITAIAYPSTECSSDDVLKFIEYFAWDAKHGMYKAVGDVGSVWSGHMPHLKPITTGLLVRHPARVLNTRLTIYPGDQSYSAIPRESAICIREIWGIELEEQAPIDQIFLHDAFIFASQVWALDKTDFVIRIEDMQEPEYCRRTLQALTGLDYDHGLVDRALSQRVNHRTEGSPPIEQIVARFSPRQREWYRVILRDIVPYFGYSLMNETEPAVSMDAKATR